MNGRVYDYNLGRFLSVDPFIQSPGNSQSMNPYSYIMNNPLSGTDPSGYAVVWDRKECESRGGDCNAEVGQVLSKLGFEVSNGYVNLNRSNVTSTSISDLMSDRKDDILGIENFKGKKNFGSRSITGATNLNSGEQVIPIIGGNDDSEDPKNISRKLAVDYTTNPGGFDSANEAALGFYKKNDELYESLPEKTELLGGIVTFDQDGKTRYQFTDATVVPQTFSGELTISGLRGSGQAVALAHTHPFGGGESFSPKDVTMAERITFYVRTPSRDVRVLTPKVRRKQLGRIRSVSRRSSASLKGKSICSGNGPCF